MPVNAHIRLYIENHITQNLSESDFQTQLEVIITDIFTLTALHPADAHHTSRYLTYTISSRLMRSNNDAQQAAYAQQLTALFQRLYNEASFIQTFNTLTPQQTFPILANLYNIHYALTLNGLRAPDAPFTLDVHSPLRMLQIIINAAYGPWNAYVRLHGGIRDYYHTRVNLDAVAPHIEIGRPRGIGINQQITVTTWNMQGSSETSDTKWRTRVLQLARTNDMVLIQEAGVRPFSSDFVNHLTTYDQFGVEHTVEHYIWHAGTARRPEDYHLFFLDVQRLRVNLALVVADANTINIENTVIISDGLPNTDNVPPYRPAFGLQVRNSAQSSHREDAVTIFNFHAISGGGPNAPRIIREVAWHTDTPFAVLGDFNRDPQEPDLPQPLRGNWISPPDIARIEPANSNTHPSTAPQNMLDYAVTNGTAQATPPGLVNTPGPSDHLAVGFTLTFELMVEGSTSEG
ncbi:endonuclease/exonuclease/phosphatase family protein [Pseudomonas sp. AL 58]|uniref:endonuclease/exonuclease/phosphatase family protein n=1 Tax=Pseudomonas sp. AL 58 TaxID=3104275 RepID=UPI002EBC6935|nr:endonuclease/exonuclease/phosphatase family protein [Pseudomonas sp. AL 58]